MYLRLKMCFLYTLIAFSSHAQPNERMHVHFDKDIYLPGETVWFKAYLYAEGRSSTASTNFYAAIYDEKGKLVQQKMYPIVDGTSNGEFQLSDTLLANRLQFIAFTKTMYAADSNDRYKRILEVYQKPQSPTTIVTDNNIQVQFFPEGGNWVAGLDNYLAYKAWYKDGSPAIISGNIIDEATHTVIDSFFTNQHGMGRLRFKPELKPYAAVWKDADGHIAQTALPQVVTTGATLHLELIKNELYYVVNKNVAADNLQILHLLAQTEGEELYKANLLMRDKDILVNHFSADSFPPGIIQFTLFDNNWAPLQERIIFINKSEQQTLITRQEKIDREPKAKNIIELEMPGRLFTNLSASIADVNFYADTIPGIEADLWFNTQLKGINNSVIKILQDSDAATTDLVMLTHGWRKYNWQNILNKKTTGTTAIDNYLSLDVTYQNSKTLSAKEQFTMMISDKANGKQFYTIPIASQNNFSKSGLVFYDSARIYYQLATDKELAKYLTIKPANDIKMPQFINPLDSFLIQPKKAARVNSTGLDALMQFKPSRFNDVQTIKEVVVKSRYVNPVTKRILELDERYTSGLFRGIARGYQLNVLDDPDADMQDIFNYILYRIPGITVATNKQTLEKAFYQTFARVSSDPIPLFLDERETFYDAIDGLQMSQVAYIKYIPGVVITSSIRSANGAIYIYTKKGNDIPVASRPLAAITIKGYDIPKEFFNPDYSGKNTSAQTDLRTTLYWNPYLTTDQTNNKVKIEYFNNDVSKKLLLTIEGIDETGKLIHLKKIIE